MTKEYLKKYRGLVKELKQLEERSANYRAICEVQGIRISGMPKGGVMPDYMAKYMDMERMIELKRYEIICELTDMEAFIQSVPDSTAQAIIEYRYIRGWNWTKIAGTVHLDRSSVFRIHNKYVESKSATL